MLRRKNRISKDFFRKDIRESKSLSTSLFTVRVVKNLSDNDAKFAVIVSKKVAQTAVGRNRIRRKVYGAIGSDWMVPLAGFLFYIYPKKEVLDSSHLQLQSTLKEAFKKIGF